MRGNNRHVFIWEPLSPFLVTYVLERTVMQIDSSVCRLYSGSRDPRLISPQLGTGCARPLVPHKSNAI